MLKDKITSEMVGVKYRTGILAFSKLIADPTLRLNFTQEADSFFRRCALGVWNHGGPVTEKHVDAYNSICSQGNASANVLYFELSSSVLGAPEFVPPAFFSDMIRMDRSSRRKIAPKFIELFSIFMLVFAAVDDEVDMNETAYIDQCTQKLQHMSGVNTDMHAYDYVTRNQVPADETPSGSDRAEQTEAAVEETPDSEPDVPAPENLEDLLAELDELCGLDQIKKDVRSLVNLVKVRKLREENGLTVPPMSLHMVFMGNPGTGKTTVARLMARIYHSIGVLSKGQLIETDRSGLVAGFVGQTAIKTQEVCQKAMGGVLFIDEAYALTSQEGTNDFGKEAIEILLKNMEDHRDDLVIIVAGYSKLMLDFIHSNPGLESRFNKYFYFEDYTAEQLLTILQSQCRKSSYILSDEAVEKARNYLTDAYENRTENFGNAREVRNLFEDLVSCQSDRIAAMENPTKDDLMLITAEDFDAAVGSDEDPEGTPPADGAPTSDTPSE